MKSWTRFIVIMLALTLAVYGSCVTPIYLLVRNRLSDYFEQSSFSFSQELIISTRQNILLQDVTPIYQRIDQVAPEHELVHFNLEYLDADTSFGRKIAQLFRPPEGEPFKPYKAGWTVLDRKEDIVYFRVGIFADMERTAEIATATFGFSKEGLNRDLRVLQVLFFVLFVIGCSGFGLVFFVLYRRLEVSIKSLLTYFTQISQGKPADPSKSLVDFSTVIETATNMAVELKESQQRIRELETSEAIGRLTAQVAHDIRSPLSAMNMVLSTMVDFPESKRTIVVKAVQRINDIANSLLTKSRETKSESSEIEVVLLSGLIDSVISEKRAEYRNRVGVEIKVEKINEYGLFVKVNSTEFARVISNVVNNSVEAIEGTGFVSVHIESDPSSIFVKIMDNGKGIPESVLPRLGRRGFSFDTKKNGSGLGLFHAQESLKMVGGRLRVESKVGLGTTVTVALPRIATADWFFGGPIVLTEPSRVVSVDDDASVHEIWSRRLSSAQHMRFSSLEKFEKWHKENGRDSDFYLIDHEFSQEGENGISTIARLGISRNSVLVTSRYEEPSLQQLAIREGIRILPKFLAASVPIRNLPAS